MYIHIFTYDDMIYIYIFKYGTPPRPTFSKILLVFTGLFFHVVFFFFYMLFCS